MNVQSASNLERFLTTVLARPRLWRSFDVRTLAGKTDGSLLNLVTFVRLDTRPARAVPRISHLPTTPHLTARQMVRPLVQLPAFLRAVFEGEASIAGIRVTFREPGNTTDAPPRPYGSSNVNIASSLKWVSHDTGAVGHVLRLTGGSSENFFRSVQGDRTTLDRELQTLRFPWEDVDALTRHGFGTTLRCDHGVAAGVDVVAPIEAWFDQRYCSLGMDMLTIGVQVSCRLIAAAVRVVGWAGIDVDGHPTSGTIGVPKSAWQDDGNGYLRATVAIPVPPLVYVKLFLRAGPYVADDLIVRGKIEPAASLRLAIYRRFDPELNKINEWLYPSDTPSGKDAIGFERAVARLLTLAGLASEHMFGLTDGPDVIAFSPLDDEILVIECTMGGLAGSDGKLSRLVQRRATVEELADNRLPHPTVTPVFVTALSRQALAPADLDAAARNGIAVLAREDLVEFMDSTVLDVAVKDHIEFIRSRVPQRSHQ